MNDLFARNAVHAALAGKTGLVIGFLPDEFIHVPIELLASHRKCADPAGPVWSAPFTRGQSAKSGLSARSILLTLAELADRRVKHCR